LILRPISIGAPPVLVGVGPLGPFGGLALVVDHGAVGDVDDLRHGNLPGAGASTLEVGDEVLGEPRAGPRVSG
jgi:hypothetical protein